MLARPPKRPRDPNQLGKLIVDLATGEALVHQFGFPLRRLIHLRPESPVVETASSHPCETGRRREDLIHVRFAGLDVATVGLIELVINAVTRRCPGQHRPLQR